MSEDPREASIREFWRKKLRENVEDEVSQMMITLLEQEEQRLQTFQGFSSRTNRRRYVDREREAGYDRLIRDYFSNNLTFNSETFHRRFRMQRDLFILIVDALESHSDYFKWRRDATGKKGLSPLQKCMAALCQLAYASLADSLDEYIWMGERNALDCLVNFCQFVIQLFGARYLRRPTIVDTQRLIQMNEQRHGFLGMLASLDCMHWEWRNCPVAWKGQYTRGDYGGPTIILEVVASADLWIWHVFFDVAGSCNDINVQRYPKRKKFKERQEAARKDVERAFGVLQSQWAIVRGPARSITRPT